MEWWQIPRSADEAGESYAALSGALGLLRRASGFTNGLR